MAVSRHVLKPEDTGGANGVAMLCAVLGFACVPFGLIGWAMAKPGSTARKVGLIATIVSSTLMVLIMLSAFGMFRAEPPARGVAPPPQYFDEDAKKAAPKK